MVWDWVWLRNEDGEGASEDLALSRNFFMVSDYKIS